MPDQVIRFTPEELKALVASGDINAGNWQEIVPKLDKRDSFIVTNLLAENGTLETMGMMPGPPVGGMAAMATGIPRLGKAAIDAAPSIGKGIGAGVGMLVKHPFMGAGVGGGIGAGIKKLFGMADDAAGAGAPRGGGRAPKAPSSPPAQFSGSGGQGSGQGATITPSMPTKGSVSVPVKPPPPKPPAPTGTGTPSGSIMDTGAGPKGFSMFPGKAPGTPPKAPTLDPRIPAKGGTPPKLESPSKDFAGTAERVINGGVQNDFTHGKRVTFQAGPSTGSGVPAAGLKIPGGNDPATYKAWEDLINRVAAPELPMDLLLQTLQASLEKDNEARASRKPKSTVRRKPR